MDHEKVVKSTLILANVMSVVALIVLASQMPGQALGAMIAVFGWMYAAFVLGGRVNGKLLGALLLVGTLMLIGAPAVVVCVVAAIPLGLGSVESREHSPN